MTRVGPPLELLTRRLLGCPAEFLDEPRLGARGSVHVDAVVSDVITKLGGASLTAAQAGVFQFTNRARDRNRLRLALVTCWLLGDPWFAAQAGLAEATLKFLGDGLNDLAELTQAPLCVSDADRREELARLCLRALDLLPLGESQAQAQDRLATLNSAERQRVIALARAAEERAREIRRQMAEEAARQAEMKEMRE